MIGHPVLRDDCTGQGFHQAKTIVQSAIGVNCNAQRSIRPDTRILAFNFPRRMSGHIHMTLARCSPGENSRANDLLEGVPRSVMVNYTELFWDLGFRQVGINGNPWVESPLQIIHRELVVKRDDLLDQRSRPHLVDEGLVMTLAGLHMRDAIRHVQSCQFPDNSSFNATHEPVLRPEDQVEILL